MRYYVGIYAFSSPKIEITEDEYCCLRKYKENLLIVVDIEERYEFILKCYKDFELEMFSLCFDHLYFNKSSSCDHAEQSLMLNIKINNLLSACRLYIDHLDSDIGHLCTIKSIPRCNYQVFISDVRKNSIPYKIGDLLRNYLQHKNLLIRGQKYSQKCIQNKKQKCSTFTLTPYFIKQEIISDPRISKESRKILEYYPDQIDIKPLLRAYLSEISKIHFYMRNLLNSDVHYWEKYCYKYINKALSINNIEKDDENICAYCFVCTDDDNIKEEYSLYLLFDSRRRELETKNYRIKIFEKFAISNAEDSVIPDHCDRYFEIPLVKCNKPT